MNEIQVPSQSKQSLHDVFNNLQDYIKLNIDNRVATLFNNFGIKSLVNGTSLKLSLTSGTSFNINAGVGMTADYELITLDNNTVYNLTNAIVSDTEVLVNLAANTIYVVKLLWEQVGSAPIPVSSGFNYNAESTSPEEQRYSKYSDSFVLSVQPVTSGNMPTALSKELMLAVVKTEAASTDLDTAFASFDTGVEVITATAGVVDIRYLNLLTQSDIKITDGNTLETSSITPADAGLIIKSDDDLPIEFKTAADEVLLKIDNLNSKVDVIGELYAGGWKVLTEEIYEIKEILNFRVNNITSINSMYNVNYKDSSFGDGDFAYDRGTRDRLRLNLEWGYSQITGTGVGGSGGSFTVTSGETFADDELIGYYLWVPGSPGTNYYIADNVGPILTLHSSYQEVADMTSTTVTSGSPARINSNVTKYEIVAVPYVGDALDDRDVEGSSVTYGTSPVVMRRGLTLESGVKYNVQIRGIRNEVVGPWTPLLWDSTNTTGDSGSFDYMGVTYSYGPNGNIIMKHVTLTDSTATLTSLSTPSGFKLTLTPGAEAYNWSNAEEYEFAWSDAGTIINWANRSTYESKITPQLSVEVASSKFLEYNVAVRPLIGRMSVGTPKTAVVVSGTGGSLPANNIIATQRIVHYTFSGPTVDYDPATQGLWFSGNIYSPSESTDPSTFLNLKEGSIITITTGDYMLTRRDAADGTKWKFYPMGNSVWPDSETTYSYEIGTSEKARQVYSSILPIDNQITKIEAMCEVHDGDDVTIRVYQDAGSRVDFADYTLVTGDAEGSGSGQTFSGAGDHLVLGVYGTRKIAIDLWDPTDPGGLNDGSFVGTINIYGRPFTKTAFDNNNTTG